MLKFPNERLDTKREREIEMGAVRIVLEPYLPTRTHTAGSFVVPKPVLVDWNLTVIVHRADWAVLIFLRYT